MNCEKLFFAFVFLLALMNSVSANGYQIVVGTSQAVALPDVNIATIQVCRTWCQSTVLQNIVSTDGNAHKFVCHNIYILFSMLL
jgi:hypothetical protein